MLALIRSCEGSCGEEQQWKQYGSCCNCARTWNKQSSAGDSSSCKLMLWECYNSAVRGKGCHWNRVGCLMPCFLAMPALCAALCLLHSAMTADANPTDAMVLWAVLAEECMLTRLLSHAELFMAKTPTPESWLHDNPATSQLSSACPFRVWRAAQEYTTASKEAVVVHGSSAYCGYAVQRCAHKVCVLTFAGGWTDL